MAFSNTNIKLGAGNSFLGGLAAGIILSGDMYEGRGCSSIPDTKRSTYSILLRSFSRVACNRLGVFHHRTGRFTCSDLYTN